MAQLLGLAAARRNGLAEVRTFSGGTEATAFNPRAVAALERVGFAIAPSGQDGKNPRYTVRLGPGLEPVEAFSKRFSDPPNPPADFVAVMTCSQADAACPFVQGAVARVAVPYEDPKVADGTPEEATRYDERVAQIGRDLAWVFGRAASR
jgi:protein-tyrosine-phosphatase